MKKNKKNNRIEMIKKNIIKQQQENKYCERMKNHQFCR